MAFIDEALYISKQLNVGVKWILPNWLFWGVCVGGCVLGFFFPSHTFKLKKLETFMPLNASCTLL